MSLARYLVYLLQVIAATLAWRVALPRPAHRAAARYLTLVAVADPLRALLAWVVLHPAREALGAGVPYQGAARAAFRLDQGLFLAGPIGLAIVATVVFLGQKAPRFGHLLGFSALLWAALAVGYPSEPGPAYEAWRGIWWPGAIAGAHVLEQLVVWGLAVWWMRRNPGEWVDETSKIVMALACADLALWLTGVLPGTAGDIAGRWHLGDATRAAILVWVCWAQVAWLRSTRPAA